MSRWLGTSVLPALHLQFLLMGLSFLGTLALIVVAALVLLTKLKEICPDNRNEQNPVQSEARL